MRITTKRNLPLLIVAVLLLATGMSCSFTKSKGIAEAAVKQFHDRYNAGQYHEIYVETDEGFKKAASEVDFTALMEAVQRKLGAVKKSDSLSWGVNTTTGGTIATVSYNVDFAEGKGTEQFAFHITGDKALLFNYNINSPALVIK
jgi:diacylglycerol kinase family enzyme